jgi:hypothetical protein
MHYVYCFVKGVEKASVFPRGLGGRKVRVVSSAGIGAVVSEGNPDTVVGNVENVLVHQEVVGRALELCRSVIPCRFGVWVTDEAGVIALLRKNASPLETHLTKLAGKVEVGIKAILNGRQDEPVLVGAHGRAPLHEGLTAGERYLLEKRERYHGAESLSGQARRLSQELNKATSPFWTAVQTESKQVRQGVKLSLFYLIERDKLGSFKNAYGQFCEQFCKQFCERFYQEAPHCKLLYTGPWPPYSFAEVILL